MLIWDDLKHYFKKHVCHEYILIIKQHQEDNGFKYLYRILVAGGCL